MNNRTEIKNIILEIENKFDVNNWKINELHIWPLVRIRLYLLLAHNHNIDDKNNNKHPDKNINERFFIKVKSYIALKYFALKNIIKYLVWINKIPQTKNLFTDADVYRVDYKNKRYNRFFDTFVEQNNIYNDSLFLLFDKKTINNIYHKEKKYIYHSAFEGFKLLRKYAKVDKQFYFKLDNYNNFILYLNNNLITQKYAPSFSIDKVKEQLISFYIKKEFFKKIFSKTKVKKLHVLCYYSPEPMAMIVAANQLAIDNEEYQHGPQTTEHLAYATWTKLPDEGYDMLPRNFWCWDESSKKIIEKWILSNKKYSAKNRGNLWIDFWKKQEIKYSFENYILYSLQPNPVKTEELFDDKIIQAIINSNYLWFIRLHPSQINHIDDYKNIIKQNGIEHKVNIENATFDPLPQILSSTKLHITFYSGTAIEATFFNVYTIFLSDLAINNFKDIIEENKGGYLDLENENFNSNLNNIINEKCNK
jgi:hypothetical protein